MIDDETPTDGIGEETPPEEIDHGAEAPAIEGEGIDFANMESDAAADKDKNAEPEFGGSKEVSPKLGKDLEAVYDIPVNVSAILGRTHMDVSSLLKLEEGNVLELDRKVGEAIDIFVNNRLIARGEVVLVEDRLGVTMTEIVKGSES